MTDTTNATFSVTPVGHPSLEGQRKFITKMFTVEIDCSDCGQRCLTTREISLQIAAGEARPVCLDCDDPLSAGFREDRVVMVNDFTLDQFKQALGEQDLAVTLLTFAEHCLIQYEMEDDHPLFTQMRPYIYDFLDSTVDVFIKLLNTYRQEGDWEKLNDAAGGTEMLKLLVDYKKHRTMDKPMSMNDLSVVFTHLYRYALKQKDSQ